MKLVKDESGQALVVVAAFMAIAAVGFLAFALDVGSMFRQKRMAQSAADAAAYAAAQELSNGTGNQQAVANSIAKLNGFDTTAATNPATVTLTTPTTGNFTGSSYVQATVSRPVPTVFLGAFAHRFATMPVAATAIAGGGSGGSSQTCICLSGSSGQSLNMSNNGTVNATTCGIVDNSSSSNAIGIVGSATLNAATLGTVSTTWDNGSNINNGGNITATTKIVQGITSTCNPPLPAAPTFNAASCIADPGGSYGTFTWGPATASSVICYNGLTVGANGSTCTLNPGIYVINNGNLHFESGANGKSNQGGNGVFFYLTGTASMSIDNGAIVNLVAGGATTATATTAPTVGAYNGYVVYQASADTNALSLQGGSTTYMNGALFAPSATINIGNGSTMTGAILANTLNVTGGAIVNATADAAEGSLVIGNPKLVQ